MKRVKNTITSEYINYPIVKYIKILQPNWTKIFAMKMIRTGNVLVNKSKTKINYRLQEGDNIELYGYPYGEVPPEKFNFSKLKPLNVVYEDDHVIIVNKETGISVQSDEKSAFNNMNNRLLNHLNWNPNNQINKWKPIFIHRLDRNTSGLLIGSKTYNSYLDLNQAMKERKIDKYYIAKVNGLVPFKTKKIHNYLLKLPKEKKVVPVDPKTPNSKEAISEVKLIKHIMETKESILEVKLVTGRTHQIRSHLSSIGFPIRGDQKYGIEKEKKKYPFPQLQAYKIFFSKEISGKTISNLKERTFTLKNQ